MRMIGWMLAASVLAFAGVAGAQVTYSNRPPPPPNQYPNRPPPGYGQQTISCGSPQYHLARCPLPGNWRGVRLVRRTSDSACVQGQSWGYDRGSVWVDKGCGGVFAPGNGGGWQPGPGWNHDFTVSCGSPQYHRAFCQVDVGAGGQVRLQRQTSSTRCIEGQNWGWNRAGVWVDRGCGAEFLIVRRW
jgi:hypothetical protein